MDILDENNDQEIEDKFIIVETTFKVYAYTSSKRYLALLKLFTRIEYVLPNLLIGTLSRESL
jgi:transcription initiation factor TFIIH subunit 4